MKLEFHHYRYGEKDERLDLILGALKIINFNITKLTERMTKLMADIQNLSDDLDQIKAGVLDAQTAIAELQAQIAAITPGAATQEQLDALDAKTEEIKALLTPAA